MSIHSVKNHLPFTIIFLSTSGYIIIKRGLGKGDRNKCHIYVEHSIEFDFYSVRVCVHIYACAVCEEKTLYLFCAFISCSK